MKCRIVLAALCAVSLFGCEEVLLTPVEEEDQPRETLVLLEDVARVLSHVELESEQLDEVHDAAQSSATNGYDEEYRMQELFSDPGCGVGESDSTKTKSYSRPLRDLLREAAYATKASAGLEDPDAWLEALSASDIQIYCHFPSSGTEMPSPSSLSIPGETLFRTKGISWSPMAP